MDDLELLHGLSQLFGTVGLNKAWVTLRPKELLKLVDRGLMGLVSTRDHVAIARIVIKHSYGHREFPAIMIKANCQIAGRGTIIMCNNMISSDGIAKRFEK